MRAVAFALLQSIGAAFLELVESGTLFSDMLAHAVARPQQASR